MTSESLGDHVRARRRELGLTQRDLAERVDTSFQHISDIERGRSFPSVELVYRLADHLGDHGRLIHMLRDEKVPQGAGAVGSEPISVTAHLFYPAAITARQYDMAVLQHSNPLAYARVINSSREVPGRVYLYPYRVALVHEVHAVTAKSLREIARWRAGQIARKDDAVRVHLQDLGLEMEVDDVDLYCLACFAVRSLPWVDAQVQDRAIQLLACPSVLLYDGSRRVDDSSDHEESLLHGVGSVSDLNGFSMDGSHVGWAAWAGVALFDKSTDFAIERELIDLELSLQSIWCYANNVERQGLLSPEYGADFLRLARRRLIQPKSTEHTSMRLLREAVVQTSRVTQVIDGALDALSSCSE